MLVISTSLTSLKALRKYLRKKEVRDQSMSCRMIDVSLVRKRPEYRGKNSQTISVGAEGPCFADFLRDIDARWLIGLVKYKNHRWSETQFRWEGRGCASQANQVHKMGYKKCPIWAWLSFVSLHQKTAEIHRSFDCIYFVQEVSASPEFIVYHFQRGTS